MLAVLTTHPIQYQVPVWQLLGKENKLPFEVWYLSDHATRRSKDLEFRQDFAWDLNMLEGYPHRFLRTPPGATPNTPLRSRIAQSLPDLFRETKTTALWVQGWQVAAYWQGVWAAHKAGIPVWLRGESNALAPTPLWKRSAKGLLLGSLFKRVDEFLCIGSANRELYRSFGVPESKLHVAMYAVDNERFHRQADEIRNSKLEIRKQWGIAEDAYVVLFCGKFIPKKRPLDLIEAARFLQESHPELKTHLLFAGSGELGGEMRAACRVVFDADAQFAIRDSQSALPPASFTGFLNQTEVSKAYVAADVLVLPSDYNETWGLVVNEAMASGLSCIISDRCGCARDLGIRGSNKIFDWGDATDLADKVVATSLEPKAGANPPSLAETAALVSELYLGR